MDILTLILKSLYLLLPVYLANLFAALSVNWRFLSWAAKPIDGGGNFGQRRLLGDGKTWRGLIAGLVIAFAAVFSQTLLYGNETFKELSLIDYSSINWLILGLISGGGALLGDIVASFFKRRLGLNQGAPLPLVDQWDFITGYFLLLALMSEIGWTIIILSYLLTLILHPLSNIIGYWLKLKKVWW